MAPPSSSGAPNIGFVLLAHQANLPADYTSEPLRIAFTANHGLARSVFEAQRTGRKILRENLAAGVFWPDRLRVNRV